MAVIDTTSERIRELRLEETRLKLGLIARNTQLGYGYDVRMFAAWCKSFHRKAWPATTDTVLLYLTDLLKQGKKITTARRRKCAIVHEHRAHGLTVPNTGEIQELLHGAQRLRAEKPRQMRPLDVKELRKMSATLAGIGTSTALRDRALLVIGFASALRRSNLASLTLADVEFCRQGVILQITREKQDQEGQGRLIGLARGRRPNTCPVRVLRAWLRVRGSKPGPLFPRLNDAHRGQAMDGECICRVVKRCVAAIGLDSANYGPHSLRAGFVTECGTRGVAESLVAHQTGHRNLQTLRVYFRRTELWRGNPSAQLGL